MREALNRPLHLDVLLFILLSLDLDLGSVNGVVRLEISFYINLCPHCYLTMFLVDDRGCRYMHDAAADHPVSDETGSVRQALYCALQFGMAIVSGRIRQYFDFGC